MLQARATRRTCWTAAKRTGRSWYPASSPGRFRCQTVSAPGSCRRPRSLGSRTGPRDCWPSIRVTCRMRPSPGCGSPGQLSTLALGQLRVLHRPAVRGQAHRHRRHGTTTLFAALEVATGNMTDACSPRHRGVEFLRLLELVAKPCPRQQLPIVVDNTGAHNHADAKQWLAKNPQTCASPRPTAHGGGAHPLLDPTPGYPHRTDRSLADAFVALRAMLWHRRRPPAWSNGPHPDETLDPVLAALARAA